MPLDFSPIKWRFKASIVFSRFTVNQRQDLLPLFTARVIRVKVIANSLNSNNYRAGYLYQKRQGITHPEGKTVSLHDQYFVMADTGPYQLTFHPVRWLPSGSRVSIWEYSGSLDADDLATLSNTNSKGEPTVNIVNPDTGSNKAEVIHGQAVGDATQILGSRLSRVSGLIQNKGKHLLFVDFGDSVNKNSKYTIAPGGNMSLPDNYSGPVMALWDNVADSGEAVFTEFY
ncbi:hypothetical protein IQ266_17860 [filamentous cyanobacterium LEGE 11480]|uniref:Uncharacterized protein n=1 Tax=Romeriopsis navalis LEGE 11480 TaxID=2777977 RepID=A0A928VPY2_9CYAN|nr:hypothetical protein [Romeriopsis navalis]MBE9031602.1 hypothetical protein [Romeriopsis navalis LEGE 11480]